MKTQEDIRLGQNCLLTKVYEETRRIRNLYPTPLFLFLPWREGYPFVDLVRSLYRHDTRAAFKITEEL